MPPCPRCAELERERDEAQSNAYRLNLRDDAAATAACDAGFGDFDTIAESIQAMARAMDDLKAERDRLREQLAALQEERTE